MAVLDNAREVGSQIGTVNKIYRFNIIVRVREHSYENNYLSLLHVDFSFIENDVFN